MITISIQYIPYAKIKTLHLTVRVKAEFWVKYNEKLFLIDLKYSKLQAGMN